MFIIFRSIIEKLVSFVNLATHNLTCQSFVFITISWLLYWGDDREFSNTFQHSNGSTCLGVKLFLKILQYLCRYYKMGSKTMASSKTKLSTPLEKMLWNFFLIFDKFGCLMWTYTKNRYYSEYLKSFKSR